MINLDDYSFNYNLYLAEQEYHDNIESILTRMINEDIITYGNINESFQDTVSSYIDKVTRSAQKVWDRYKSKINEAEDKKYLVKIRDSIMGYKESSDWKITNYPDYNFDDISSIKIIPLDYDSMKEALNKKETFVSQYYGNLKFEPNSYNVKKAVENTLIQSIIPSMDANRDFLLNKFNFCASDYYKYKDLIEADLNSLNNINKTILNLSNIIPANEAVNFKTVYESMIFEAPADFNKNNNKKSMGFSDSSGEKIKLGKNNNQSMFLKRIALYMSVTTDIISGKMKVLNKAYKDYMRILEVAYKQSKSIINKSKPIDPDNIKTEIDL